jgi:hypothetical protein
MTTCDQTTTLGPVTNSKPADTNTLTQTPPRTPWTTTELHTLTTHAHLGANHLAQLLGRTPHAIRLQAARHRITLRPPGETRGIVLGQPRGTTIPTHIRARYIQTPQLATLIELDILTVTRPLCPLCATHPQEARTGICRVCHLTALTAAHETRTAIETAERNLAAARQRKHRAAVEATQDNP